MVVWIAGYEAHRVQRLQILAQFADHAHFIAVLQIPADAGEMDTLPNAQPLEFPRIADATEQEQLRGIERTAAQNHFAVGG